LSIALRGISPATRRRCIVWMAWSLPAALAKTQADSRAGGGASEVFGIILDDAKMPCRAARVSA
jgi:hypothetical protein